MIFLGKHISLSANVLMKEIHPLGIVPYHIIMNALAYQADPTSVEPIKHTSKEVIFYALLFRSLSIKTQCKLSVSCLVKL